MGVPWRHLFRSTVRMMTPNAPGNTGVEALRCRADGAGGGFATVVEIAADQTRRGSIVYHIPEASGSYTFVYSNPPIALTIPFTLHV